MDRRLGIVLVVGVACVVGVAAWRLTSPAEPPPAIPKVARASKVAVTPVNKARPRPAQVADVPGAAPIPALVVSGPLPGDEPALRARLEVQAKLALPYWARIAPKVQDPALRTRTAEMFTRLSALGEPASDLARAEYELTQELITEGGFDHKSQVWVDYLNSTSAAVLQNGDPAEVITPEEAARR